MTQEVIASKILSGWAGVSRRDFVKMAASYAAAPPFLHGAAAGKAGFAVRKAPLFRLPGAKNPNRHKDGVTDCNSPSHWVGNTLYVFGSWEQPWRTSGPDLFHLKPTAEVEEVHFDNPELKKLWIWLESTHQDEYGRLYGWIHNEVPNLCRKGAGAFGPPGYPIVVRIGALRSEDNGLTWKDLGFIMEDPASAILCDTEDTWYAGGMGDFCVFPDKAREWFYFFFVNYGNKFEDQGLCLARMRYEDRDSPRTKIWMWTGVDWSEPGLGGRPKPFFPATRDITHADGQTFWGPTIHWNTYLKKYVMFLNRIRNTKWETEGLYVSYSQELGNPHAWSQPVKFMDRQEAIHADPESVGNGWYVQIMGTGPGETDKLAGKTARLFVDGASAWEIEFQA